MHACLGSHAYIWACMDSEVTMDNSKFLQYAQSCQYFSLSIQSFLFVHCRKKKTVFFCFHHPYINTFWWWYKIFFSHSDAKLWYPMISWSVNVVYFQLPLSFSLTRSPCCSFPVLRIVPLERLLSSPLYQDKRQISRFLIYSWLFSFLILSSFFLLPAKLSREYIHLIF